MLLQHGCSLSNDHHTSVKQTRLTISYTSKKDTLIFSRVLLRLFSGLKILVSVYMISVFNIFNYKRGHFESCLTTKLLLIVVKLHLVIS